MKEVRPSAHDESPHVVVMASAEKLTRGTAAATHVSEIAGGLAALGWNVEVCGVGAGPRWLEYARLWARLARAAERSVIYLRFHPAFIPLIGWLNLRRRVIVVEVNGALTDLVAAYPRLAPIFPLYAACSRLVLRQVSALVGASGGITRWLRDWLPGTRVVEIPNGADVSTFVPGPQDTTKFGGPYAIFFGSFAPWQGIPNLLAAERDHRWPTDLQLVIVGHGHDADLVRRAAGSRARVHYLGRLGWDRLAPLVRGAAASIIVKDESAEFVSPLKLYESLASGVPVVVSPHEDQRRLVEQLDVGVVVPHGQPPALASALSSLYDDADARARARLARAVIERDHSWAARARSTADLLSDALEAAW